MNNIPTSPNTPVAELERLFDLQKANKQRVEGRALPHKELPS
jgi:hypothetical protein